MKYDRFRTSFAVAPAFRRLYCLGVPLGVPQRPAQTTCPANKSRGGAGGSADREKAEDHVGELYPAFAPTGPRPLQGHGSRRWAYVYKDEQRRKLFLPLGSAKDLTLAEARILGPWPAGAARPGQGSEEAAPYRPGSGRCVPEGLRNAPANDSPPEAGHLARRPACRVYAGCEWGPRASALPVRTLRRSPRRRDSRRPVTAPRSRFSRNADAIAARARHRRNSRPTPRAPVA